MPICSLDLAKERGREKGRKSLNICFKVGNQPDLQTFSCTKKLPMTRFSLFSFFSFSQPIRTDAKFWQVNRAWGTKSNPLEASHPSPIVNFVKWDDKRDEIHLTRWGRWSSESGTKSWRWSPQFRPCLLFWQVQTGPKLSISSKYDTHLL